MGFHKLEHHGLVLSRTCWREGEAEAVPTLPNGRIYRRKLSRTSSMSPEHGREIDGSLEAPREYLQSQSINAEEEEELLVSTICTHEGSETWATTICMAQRPPYTIHHDHMVSNIDKSTSTFTSCQGWLKWANVRRRFSLLDPYDREVATLHNARGPRAKRWIELLAFRKGLLGGTALIDEVVTTAMALHAMRQRQEGRQTARAAAED